MSDDARLTVGEVFQRSTRYARDAMPAHRLDWGRRPEPIKTYPQALRVALETPRLKGGASLWEALKNRRSVRRYSDLALTLTEVSRLCWAAQGVTARQEERLLRTAPSAGALYPIETFVVANRVVGLASGLYHYAVAEHALEQLHEGDLGAAIAQAALDQTMLREAALVFVWSAVFARSKWKYAQRAYRYIYLDAGHIAQNVALAAVGLGLGSCQVAAFYDDQANALLGLDGESEAVVYMTAVGRPR